MTTINQARDGIYKRVIAEWVDGADPLTPYTFDNEPFDPPVGDGAGAPWARFSVRNLSAGPETLGGPGNRRFTRSAIARAEIYTVPGKGLKAADVLAKAAQDMFEGRTLLGTSIKFYEVQSAEVGAVDEGRWFLSTVQASFNYDEIK